MALSRRNELPPLKEPPYDFVDVPKCKRDLEGSCVIPIDDRSKWIDILAELLLLCNEAADRNEARTKQQIQQHTVLGDDAQSPPPLPPLWTGKPLSVEYIADRLDLDDPLKGYVVRTKAEGWLQGYITVTTFTTWQKWFRWDSLIDEAGVLPFDHAAEAQDLLLANQPEGSKHHQVALQPKKTRASAAVMRKSSFKRSLREERELQWRLERKVDADGRLAAALQAQLRDGDPNDQGVIWPRIAEISLLGGIGCGSTLVRLVLDELEQRDSPYDYVVLQATENSVPFYESHGFVRVGAVARYQDKAKPEQKKPKPGRASLGSSSPTGINKAAVPPPMAETSETTGPDLPGTSSPFFWYESSAEDTPRSVAERFNVPLSDLFFINQRVHGNTLRAGSRMFKGTKLRIPVQSNQNSSTSYAVPVDATTLDTLPMVWFDAREGMVSGNGVWYCSLEDETPKSIARKLGKDVKLLCAVNQSRYEGLTPLSPLRVGTQIRIPGNIPTFQSDQTIATLPAAQGHSHDQVATLEGRIAHLDDAFVEDAYSERDTMSELMTYRHWAFEDDNVALSCASYMMARPLKHNRAQRGSPSKPVGRRPGRASSRKSPHRKQRAAAHGDDDAEGRSSHVTSESDRNGGSGEGRGGSVDGGPGEGRGGSVDCGPGEGHRVPGEGHSDSEVPAPLCNGNADHSMGPAPTLGSELTTPAQPKLVQLPPLDTYKALAKDFVFGPVTTLDYRQVANQDWKNQALFKEDKENQPEEDHNTATDDPDAEGEEQEGGGRRSVRRCRRAVENKRKRETGDPVLDEEMQREQRIEEHGIKMNVYFQSSALVRPGRHITRGAPLMASFTDTEKKKLGIYQKKIRQGSRRSSRRATVESETNKELTPAERALQIHQQIRAFMPSLSPVFNGLHSDNDSEDDNEDDSGDSDDNEDDREDAKTPDLVKVFLVNAPLLGPFQAAIEEPLKDVVVEPDVLVEEPKPRPVEPKKPKRGMSAFLFYSSENRGRIARELPHLRNTELSRELAHRWKTLQAEEKQSFLDLAERDRERYRKDVEKYMIEKERFETAIGLTQHKRLINKVVTVNPKPNYTFRDVALKRLQGEPVDNQVADLNEKARVDEKAKEEAPPASEADGDRTDGANAIASNVEGKQLYFVLTYIPDLQWCRLAPMKKKKVFESGRYVNRTRWVLVPEGEAQELDVSASRCEIVQGAHAVKKVNDADKEEWVLLREQELQDKNAVQTPIESAMPSQRKRSRNQPVRKAQDDDDDDDSEYEEGGEDDEDEN